MFTPTGKELIDPYKVLNEAGIATGMTVADFGCGTLGHYALPAARLVGPAGRVLCVDILKSVLEGVQSRVKLEGITNLETVWGDLERDGGVKIGDGIVDIGLIINNLFMSQQKQQFVREALRMVKPGGRVVVVDWKTTGVAFGPSVSMRVTPEDARQLMESAGLMFEKDFEPGQYHYGMVFKKG